MATNQRRSSTFFVAAATKNVGNRVLDGVSEKNKKAVIQIGGNGGLSVYPEQNIVMKLAQKLLIVGTVVTFASFSQAWAGGKQDAEPAPAVEDPAVTPDEENVVDEEVLGEDAGVCEGSEGVICKHTDRDGVTDKGEVVDIEDGESASPEVQRGEGGEMNPDLIFYTTVLDGSPEGESSGKVGPAFGSDERAADIEAKGPRISAVKSLKKGPVALVKKGRVYLR